MSDPGSLDGLTGWVADVISSLGETGVGLLVALENIIPPIPSELVLAMAGYLASEGRVNVVLVTVAATLGSLAGALALYGFGHIVGVDRLRRWLDRLPLVDSDQLNTADRWFDRYGNMAVLFGRMVPVVRSLVSIPAGASRMPLPRFIGLTVAGSGAWNSIFVGLGYTLGSQWQEIDRYNTWFDLGILAIFAAMIGAWVVKRLRHHRSGRGERAGRP